MAPITVLIGKNNTGKSTFLEALLRVSGSKHCTEHDGKQGGRALAFHGTAGSSEIRVLEGHYPLSIASVLLSSNGPKMTASGVSDGTGAPPIEPEFVPKLVDWLLRRDRDRFFALVGAMKDAIPGLQDVRVAVPQPHLRRIDLVVENGWEVQADEVSPGTRMLMYFLAVAWHPDPPQMVQIEEPENGLHPKRLASVMSILRSLSDGAHAKVKPQVVLTTHSPYLLDLVEPEKDSVVVFRREPDGACVADALDTGKIAAFLDEFGLGEVWSNEGEQGLVP